MSLTPSLVPHRRHDVRVVPAQHVPRRHRIWRRTNGPKMRLKFSRIKRDFFSEKESKYKKFGLSDETRLEQLLSRLAQNKFSLAHTKVSVVWALSDQSFRCIWSRIWYVPLCLTHEKSRVRS
jgi:hypothetical protein